MDSLIKIKNKFMHESCIPQAKLSLQILFYIQRYMSFFVCRIISVKAKIHSFYGDRKQLPARIVYQLNFYKSSGMIICKAIIRALNFYGIGHLFITQRRGIMKLIPKKDSEPH